MLDLWLGSLLWLWLSMLLMMLLVVVLVTSLLVMVMLFVMVFVLVSLLGINLGTFFKVSFLSLFALNALGNHVGNMGLDHVLDLAVGHGLGAFASESLLNSAGHLLNLLVNLGLRLGGDASLKGLNGALLLKSKE
jgi:hypothetical protein